jgi:hypothetical protein
VRTVFVEKNTRFDHKLQIADYKLFGAIAFAAFPASWYPICSIPGILHLKQFYGKFTVFNSSDIDHCMGYRILRLPGWWINSYLIDNSYYCYLIESYSRGCGLNCGHYIIKMQVL